MNESNNENAGNATAPVSYTLTNLSELLNYRRQSLKSLLDECGVIYEVGARGSHLYTLENVFKGIVDRNKTPSDVQETSGSGEQDKARLTKAKADLAELELAKKQGVLVDAGLVLSTVASEYATVRTQLLTIPQSMAVDLSVISDPEAIQQKLDERINTILLALQADADSNAGELEIEELTPELEESDE